MNKTTDKKLDRALQAVMHHRATLVPKLAEDFAEQVISKMNARRQRAHHYRVVATIVSIAAAILIGIIIWPMKDEEVIIRPKQQNAMAKVIPPEPIPKKKVETKTSAPRPKMAPKHRAVAASSVTQQQIQHEFTETEITSPEILPEPEHMIASYYDRSDPFLLASAHAQDIRTRGEQLCRKVELIMNF